MCIGMIRINNSTHYNWLGRYRRASGSVPRGHLEGDDSLNKNWLVPIVQYPTAADLVWR